MLSDDRIDRLVDRCVDVVGGDLRSIASFTEDAFDQIFLRDYLSAEADIKAFVDNERDGFTRVPTHERSELGRYQYTIRVFEHGYLTRAIVDQHGVFVTTNQVTHETHDELAATLVQEMST